MKLQFVTYILVKPLLHESHYVFVSIFYFMQLVQPFSVNALSVLRYFLDKPMRDSNVHKKVNKRRCLALQIKYPFGGSSYRERHNPLLVNYRESTMKLPTIKQEW